MEEELQLLLSMTKQERLQFLLDQEIEQETRRLEKTMDEIQECSSDIQLAKGETQTIFRRHKLSLLQDIKDIRERVRWLRTQRKNSSK